MLKNLYSIIFQNIFVKSVLRRVSLRLVNVKKCRQILKRFRNDQRFPVFGTNDKFKKLY